MEMRCQLRILSILTIISVYCKPNMKVNFNVQVDIILIIIINFINSVTESKSSFVYSYTQFFTNFIYKSTSIHLQFQSYP